MLEKCARGDANEEDDDDDDYWLVAALLHIVYLFFISFLRFDCSRSVGVSLFQLFILEIASAMTIVGCLRDIHIQKEISIWWVSYRES